ncbi:MAG TPA: glycosyltransferase family 39 protein [Flavipsychrobacter sp.]|nr:glycosyltransferase family 39 protein [Flavipsychrobacter sp.]
MPKVPIWVFIFIGLLYFSAVRIDTMDVDASQYAEMSREMSTNKDYLHLYDRGRDYLDKPPFLFWVSSLSIQAFGANNFGYKLPSILFALLAVYATYRLARLLYDEATGRMAALILATCQGMFLMTNDIRCDTILMGWVITAIWLIKEWDISRKLPYFILGCVCIAFGLMTKGPIAIMVPVFCFASDWILKGEWRKLFRLEYFLGLIIIGLLLIPMSIGLYQQFDLHPEKIVNGKQGVSGLRFFFWSQSFGRITGESPWNNGADISFLMLNMLWSFLPWIFLFLTGLVINIINLVKQKFHIYQYQEWISSGGFILAYLALGSSHYQLPHYIFVVFPLAAIVTASLLRDIYENGRYPRLCRILHPAHIFIVSLLFLVTLLMLTVVFPAGAVSVILWVIAFAIWLFIWFRRRKLKGKILWICASGIVLINIFVTNHFYYHLLQYQLGSQVGRFIKIHNIPADSVASYNVHDPLNSISFYAGHMITNDSPSFNKNEYILTMNYGLRSLQQKGLNYDIVKSGVFFKVSELTPEFLNPNTRDKAVSDYYLVRLK